MLLTNEVRQVRDSVMGHSNHESGNSNQPEIGAEQGQEAAKEIGQVWQQDGRSSSKAESEAELVCWKQEFSAQNNLAI